MIENWALNLALMFIMRQLLKFADAIAWPTVKTDVASRVRALVPGTWFDDDAVAVAETLIDMASAVLHDGTDIEAFLKAVAGSDWNGALTALKTLVIAAWETRPRSATEQRVFDALKAA